MVLVDIYYLPPLYTLNDSLKITESYAIKTLISKPCIPEISVIKYQKLYRISI